MLTAWLPLQVRPSYETGPKVVGMGSCGLDYLAVVTRYPEPDTKLRTEQLEVRSFPSRAEVMTALILLQLPTTTSANLSMCRAQASMQGRVS